MLLNDARIVGGGVVDVTPPSTPTSVSMTGISTTTCRITWGASTDEAGGSGISHYVVRKDNGTEVNVGNVLTYDWGGLAEFTEYQFDVKAVDLAGNSSGWGIDSKYRRQESACLNYCQYEKKYD